MRFIFFLFPFLLFSQQEKVSKEFDSIFYHIAVNVSSANPSKAMHLADSLYIHSKTEKEKVRTLMLLADILEKQEKRGEAIIQAQKALKIAIAEDDYSFQARIHGFLSTQYRTIGFLDKGKISLDQGLLASEKIDNKKQVVKFKAMSYQERAEYALEDKEFEKAIEYLQLAIISFEKEENPQFRDFIIASVEEMLGRAYMGLEKNEESLKHFSKANLFIKKAGAENTLWAALIYRGLGEGFLKSKAVDSAGIYLNQALVISEKGGHGTLKEYVYKALAEYYQQKQSLDSFRTFDAKYKDALKVNTAHKKQMINEAYNTLQEKPEKKASNNGFFMVIGFLILFMLIYIAYNKRKILFPNFVNQSQLNLHKTVEVVLSQKTEQELLLKLEAFEASQDYLDSNMSLSKLIGILNTNTKYLRQILKNKRDSDYNNYINELRINYIANKLKTNPEYLNYKISYLAEECGFSSHSKFSANFKSVTKLSPSEFISNLKNNQT